MARKLITPPTREPLSLEAARKALRDPPEEDNNEIQALIIAARKYCENYQNRVYLEQTWELWLDGWPRQKHIEIPLPPLQSVTYIRYYGTDDTEYTLDTGEYDVDTNGYVGRVVLKYLKTWPLVTLRPSSAVVVRFVAGYSTYASTVTVANDTEVERTAGDEFNTDWQAGKAVSIAGSDYRLSSVTDADNLVLAADATDGAGQAFLADDVPEPFKQAMILHLKLLYDDYEPMLRDRMENARDSLLSQERLMPV